MLATENTEDKIIMNNIKDESLNIQAARVLTIASIHSVISVPSVAKIE